MQKIVGVRRLVDGSVYYFFEKFDVKIGDLLVVSIDDFVTIGRVFKTGIEISEAKTEEYGKILRRAADADMEKYEINKKRMKDIIKKTKSKSVELGIIMKFVCGEYSLDSSKAVIMFTSEDRVDFRQLLKDIGSLVKAKIELRQIGQRDEVKICGGVGPCGEPCCCARFLDNFEHVSVKMAKIQNLSLAPTKINGICGRLMCCLAYEAKDYEDVLAKMPKINSEVVTPNGKGIVVYNDLLRERVSIKRQTDGDNIVVEDFALTEIATQKLDNKNFKENNKNAKNNFDKNKK